MTVVEVACERAPQPGEHDVPLAVRLQVTPLLLESFCTVALTTNELAPAFRVLNLFVIVTISAELTVKVSESDLLVFATEVAVSVG